MIYLNFFNIFFRRVSGFVWFYFSVFGFSYIRFLLCVVFFFLLVRFWVGLGGGGCKILNSSLYVVVLFAVYGFVDCSGKVGFFYLVLLWFG